jgi:hypothetical protein
MWRLAVCGYERLSCQVDDVCETASEHQKLNIAKHSLDFPLLPIVFFAGRGPQMRSHFLHHRRIA